MSTFCLSCKGCSLPSKKMGSCDVHTGDVFLGVPFGDKVPVSESR